MNRKIRRLFQWVLVVTLTTVLSASPVSAGWLLHKMHRHHHAACCYVEPDPCPQVCPPPVCCPAPIDCCAPIIHESPVVAPPVIDHGCPCGCDEVVGSSAPMMVEPMMGTPIESFESSPPLDNWQPHDSGSAIQPGTDAPIESSSDVPPIVPTPIPADPDLEAPDTDPVPEPEADPNAIEAPAEDPADAPAEDPAEDPFGAADADPPPADEAPMDDLFGEPPADETAPADSAPADSAPQDSAPADEKPAEDTSIDDLFGTDAATEPAEAAAVEPGGEMPDADIFGEPATDVAAEPATGGGAATATETDSLDDLFGSDPASEASPAESEATPASPASEPATKPAKEPESNSIDDLFGDSPAGATPAEVVSQESMEDLFVDRASETEADAADGATESTVEATSINDLFGENPDHDAAAEESDGIEPAPSIEDLFGTAPETDRADVESFAELPAPPAVTPQDTVTVKVMTAEIESADPLDSTHFRTWIDNSGTYSTEGRLIEIHRSSVRVLKSNGRTCTVPNERLSAADAAYVDSIRRQLDHSLVAMRGK